MVIEKLKRGKSSGNDQISEELIKASSKRIRSEIHKLINSIWNKEELPESGRSRSLHSSISRMIKQISVIVRVISLLPPTYKILYNILLSSLNPNAEEITGDRQCGFRCDSSTIGHIF
jgi:hypothetical protein